jgi:hypothetical protein
LRNTHCRERWIHVLDDTLWRMGFRCGENASVYIMVATPEWR